MHPRANALSSGPGVETTGVEIIEESERTARPRDLFWSWFAANVSVFGISYGSFVLGFGTSFRQAVVVTVVGIVVSFVLCGVIAIAAKRGSAPTMVLSRAAFGVNGQKVPDVISWLVSIGWETFFAILTVLATATIFDQLGWASGDGTKIVATLVVAALIVSASVAGYHIIMRMQSVLTWLTGIATIVYVALTIDEIDWSAVSSIPDGNLSVARLRLHRGHRRPLTYVLPDARGRPATQEFVRLYESGDDDGARALYPVARTHWERIETVAESFGDLDPMMDAREADLEPGQKWTGWHLIEKDLWPQRATDYTPLTDQERKTYGDDLLANTDELDSLVQDLTYTVDSIANGSRCLLEEVAKGKVTGEEEYWSRTDLWDFQAKVDGARVGFEGVQPIVEEKDPELAQQLTTRFADLQKLLNEQKEGDGFKSYDDLTPDQVKGLSDAVNALSEPLSRLTAAVLS